MEVRETHTCVDMDVESILVYGMAQSDEQTTLEFMDVCKECVDVNACHNIQIGSPAIFAAQKGWDRVLQKLIDGGADLNKTDSCGETPLTVAVRSDNMDVMRVLLKTCVNMYTETFFGATARCIAYEKNKLDMVHLLDIYHLSQEGWRPRTHVQFPFESRMCMRTLALLGKLHRQNGDEGTISLAYPQACICLLPEEILQYWFVWVGTLPI